MRLHWIAPTFSLGLILGTTAFAVNPVQGFYFGVLGEMSSGPASYDLTLDRGDFSRLGVNLPSSSYYDLFSVRVNNSRFGGGGGGMLGFRYDNFRIEGEILYNWNGSGTLDLDECTLQSPDVLTPTGNCLPITERAKLGFNGSVATTYGLVNVFYDFINYQSENNVFPYVGAGIGYAQIKASGNLVATALPDSRGMSRTSSAVSAQGILGVGLFIDDYTWLGMDYRYLSTGSLSDLANRRYAINTLNFTATGSFDRSGG